MSTVDDATGFPGSREVVLSFARAGRAPEEMLEALAALGLTGQPAADFAERVLGEFLAEHSATLGVPAPVPVPAAVGSNGPSTLQVDGQDVRVLFTCLLPRIVLFGNVLSPDECNALIELARPRVRRSTVVDPETGDSQLHEARTSSSTEFERGATPLLERIERRLATLVDWPYEHGEGLQVLRYEPGQEYEPHYDWFDPAASGAGPLLGRGGQRVATILVYLNDPECGGGTSFPDAHVEIGAVKGHALFFSYDRPHAATRTLHGGMPVVRGEKWVATKWLRERPHR
jgi:prolyl 4-hydroxylase